jgi:hypothetical protein
VRTFITERDIVDVCASGVTELELDDDVVLTDVAREKATALGLRLRRVESRDNQTERLLKNLGASEAYAAPSSPWAGPAEPGSGVVEDNLVERVKAGVIANLGTTEFNGLLDQVIPQVLARLRLTLNPGAGQGRRQGD